MMDLQSLTLCNFRSGESYYLVNKNDITLPVEDVNQVQDDPPFPRESCRVFIDGFTDVTRTLLDEVHLAT